MQNTVCAILTCGLCLGAAGQPATAPAPHTDPDNRGGWELNESVSDEFNGDSLDESKWHVQGTGGHYNNNFLGRAPSQFTPHNVRIGDGFLKIVTKWEPDFAFSDQMKDGYRYENITTAAVITKAQVRYGYMEIRCKAADGPISSAFWAIGGSGELDVFEHWGRSDRNPESGRRYHTSFHDWRDPQSATYGKRIWTNDHLLDFRVAEDFHVYALEWDPEYLRIFVDGKLVRHVTREEIGDAWVADGAMKVWLDSEVFPWEAAPAQLQASDFPGDGLEYMVDYVRVWQRRDIASPTGPTPLPNLIENPALTNDAAGWTLSGQAAVVTGSGQDGFNAVQLSGKGTLEQTVELKPDTHYVLSAWVKLPGTNGKDVWQNAWLGVKDFGGEETRMKFFRSDFYRGSLQFKTGPAATSALVFFTNDQTGHTAFAERFELREAPVVGSASAAAALRFSESADVIPLEDRSRRKWDAPLIADLDQDGRLDVLLTEHGLQASVYWNNGETFSEPQVVIGGDTHGIAAGDYDHDGRMDLIVQRGGGDGTNPRNPVHFHVNPDRTIEGGEEFEHFERSRGRAAKLIDGDNDGSLDLLLTAFPLEEQNANGGNYLFDNTGQGRLEFVDYLPFAAWMGFRVLATDFDNDGVSDFLFYGGANLVAVRGGEDLAYADASEEVLGDLAGTTFVSSVAEIDYDNDGDFDLFLTRDDFPFDPETYFDPEGGRFYFRAWRKPFDHQLTVDGDFEFENLQMAYPHFDVFVGVEKHQLEFDVDRHGQKDFTLTPAEADGWPDDHSTPGLYIGHIGDGVWRVAGESRAGTGGVVHNVTAAPPDTAVKDLPALLLENRGGRFVDVTAARGIAIPELTTSAAVGDFDNNGWADLFIVRYGNPATTNEQIVYLNQDGKTFVRAQNHGVVSPELGATGGGAEAFDYDRDGDLDLIYGNEHGRWHLFTNHTADTTADHYMVVKVGRSPSGNASPLGAVLTLHADGQTYRRVVGATSAGFSQSLNTHLHVGLGACDAVDRATVRWTNGELQELSIDTVDQAVNAGTTSQNSPVSGASPIR